MRIPSKLLSKAAFYYYNLLAFITKGNKRFVDKKLLFGALLIGLSSQYGCKTKNQDNNTLVEDKKDSIRQQRTTCYENVAVDIKDSSNSQTKKLQPNKKMQKVITISSCYDVVEKPEPPATCYYTVQSEIDNDSLKPFMFVEQMPEFPGGNDSLKGFINRTIKYPELAKESDPEGTIYVNFVVESDGSITNPIILRGIGSGCDEEALRVIKLMPKWIPGKQNGKVVRVQYNLPIKFKLDE